jgi:ATP-dependent Clp protease protease subunit
MSNTPQLTPEIFAVFCGNIDQQSLARIFAAFDTVQRGDVTHVHLLFQSTGGFVGDGICLYNFFKALPIALTIYNSGSIASIAAIAYLGSQSRKCSPHATFMLHRSTHGASGQNAERLQGVVDGLVIDDERTKAILDERTKLPSGFWDKLDRQDVWFTATQAVDWGFADGIADFSPPQGQHIFNV